MLYSSCILLYGGGYVGGELGDGDEAIAVAVGFALKAADEEVAEDAGAQAAVFEGILVFAGREEECHAAIGLFEGFVEGVEAFVHIG